eukprot:m.89813 g.89813  ORF g.89813 m.89813 type:complete len:826 (+) comp8839_c5_seq1:219-2696(+)
MSTTSTPHGHQDSSEEISSFAVVNGDVCDHVDSEMNMNASDVNLTSEELIAVMESVKRGNITVEQAWKEARSRSHSQKEQLHQTSHPDADVAAKLDSFRLPPISATNQIDVNEPLQISLPKKKKSKPSPKPRKKNPPPPPPPTTSTHTTSSSQATSSYPVSSPNSSLNSVPNTEPIPTAHATPALNQVILVHEARLSNEDQLQLLNSVKDGQISIEQALKLANSTAHVTTMPNNQNIGHSRSSSSSSSIMASPSHISAYMNGDSENHLYYSDLILKRDLVLAGASIDIPSSDILLLQNQDLIGEDHLLSFVPFEEHCMHDGVYDNGDDDIIKEDKEEDDVDNEIKKKENEIDCIEIDGMEHAVHATANVNNLQMGEKSGDNTTEITRENQMLAEQISAVLSCWKGNSTTTETLEQSTLGKHKRLPSFSKRISVSLQSNREVKKVFLVPNSMKELFTMIEGAFECKLTSICTKKGAELSNTNCIRDDDDLIACDEGIFKSSCCRATSLTSLTSLSSNKIAPMQHLAPTSSKDANPTDWIKLDVGGKIFRTTRQTLTKEEGSMLALMFTTTDWNSSTDEQGAFLFDRSPKYFEPLLSYLRDGTIILDNNISPRGVLAEAHFFGLWGAIDILQPLAEKEKLRLDSTPPLSRETFTTILLACASTSTLRCQGLNFEGADLSCLDLKHINFKLANLVNCNLRNCNLEHCNFQQANLSNCVMDGSSLIGCNFSRARVDFASCKNCSFYDPSNRSHAILEGSSWRGTDFEDSNLSCVNMCASSFKRAKLRHCNLRSSNFAGADLGETDLSGCNLQDANLRGANTLHATFNKA